MRTIYSFFGKHPQVAFGGSAYSCKITEPPVFHSGRVEGVIGDCTQAEGDTPFQEGDTLHIEGSIETLREIFQDALSQLDELDKSFKEEFEEKKRHTVQCPLCMTWHDRRYQEGYHADGKGNRCTGELPEPQ